MWKETEAHDVLQSSLVHTHHQELVHMCPAVCECPVPLTEQSSPSSPCSLSALLPSSACLSHRPVLSVTSQCSTSRTTVRHSSREEDKSHCVSHVSPLKSEKLFLTGSQKTSDTFLCRNVIHAYIRFNTWYGELITMTGSDHVGLILGHG